jgi:SP family myo-inositol transporter-like MFS transporter 13
MDFEKNVMSESQISDKDHIETIEHSKTISEQATELSGIEATAASKTAWLISITVSIGGFLFGMSPINQEVSRIDYRLTDRPIL